MRDWSESITAAQSRIKAAQKSLTLVGVGGGQGYDKQRTAEAEALLMYAISDLQDAIGWARSR